MQLRAHGFGLYSLSRLAVKFERIGLKLIGLAAKESLTPRQYVDMLREMAQRATAGKKNALASQMHADDSDPAAGTGLSSKQNLITNGATGVVDSDDEEAAHASAVARPQLSTTGTAVSLKTTLQPQGHVKPTPQASKPGSVVPSRVSLVSSAPGSAGNSTAVVVPATAAAPNRSYEGCSGGAGSQTAVRNDLFAGKPLIHS